MIKYNIILVECNPLYQILFEIKNNFLFAIKNFILKDLNKADLTNSIILSKFIHKDYLLKNENIDKKKKELKKKKIELNISKDLENIKKFKQIRDEFTKGKFNHSERKQDKDFARLFQGLGSSAFYEEGIQIKESLRRSFAKDKLKFEKKDVPSQDKL